MSAATDTPEVNPLNIDAVLGKCKNRVALVGVELEGGWVQLPPGVQSVMRDGSVFNDRLPAGVKHMGELAIGPAMPAGIAELIRINHPPKVNATCGLHVHMSFETLWYYKLLMVPEYQETICHYLQLWGKEEKVSEKDSLWMRLRGESEFCRKQFWPDIQAGTKQKSHDRVQKGHRYTIIHYCGRQNTIECRVLPMFDKAARSVRAVQRVIDITNACIYELGKKFKRAEDKSFSKVQLPGDLIYDEEVIESV